MAENDSSSTEVHIYKPDEQGTKYLKINFSIQLKFFF